MLIRYDEKVFKLILLYLKKVKILLNIYLGIFKLKLNKNLQNFQKQHLTLKVSEESEIEDNFNKFMRFK